MDMEKKKTSENNKKMEMEFGVRIATHSILKELNNGCHQKNLVLSPLSLHVCLNLLAAGAKGQTLDQLLRFLDAEDIAKLNAQSSLFMELASTEPESFNASYSKPCYNDYNPFCSGSSGPLVRLTPPQPLPISTKPTEREQPRIIHWDGPSSGPTVSLVNGIWVDQRFRLKHSFKRLAGDVYKAESQSVDFSQVDKVANRINVWAKEASKGHIDGLVSSESLRGSVLVLASAIYFKASWLLGFNPSNTVQGDFYLLNGKRVRVPFMTQWRTHCIYKSFNGFRLLKMKYKEGRDGKKYVMDIFLPNRYNGLQGLLRRFHSDPKFFTQNHGHNYVELDKVVLPKLKFKYGLDHLAENIKELGLMLPFQVNAELTEIADSRDNIYVSKAIQKSYIEVNEEGTIATSVNACLLSPGCAMRVEPPPTIEFVADHPFLFVIKEELSGTVLFVGAALNPLL